MKKAKRARSVSFAATPTEPKHRHQQGSNTTPGPSTARPSGIVRRSRDGGVDGANKKPRPILATMTARPQVHVSPISTFKFQNMVVSSRHCFACMECHQAKVRCSLLADLPRSK